MVKKNKSQTVASAAPAIPHGANDDELDTNFELSGAYMPHSDSEAELASDDDEGADATMKEEEPQLSKRQKQKQRKEEAKRLQQEEEAAAASAAAAAAAAVSVKHEQPIPDSSSSTSASTSATDSSAATPSDATESKKKKRRRKKKGEVDPDQPLTKQQLNQKLAREKREREAQKAKAELELASLKMEMDQGKKRKAPEPADGSDSDSDSDSDDPVAKAQKASAADPSQLPDAHLIDTKGLTLSEAKLAIRAAKQKQKEAAKAAENEAQLLAGTHPSQTSLQLVDRNVAAVKLWELYSEDRKERNATLTPLEHDEALPPYALAQLPGHNTPKGHAMDTLFKSLKKVYGKGFQEEVCGGVLQPPLKTKKQPNGQQQQKGQYYNNRQQQQQQQGEEESPQPAAKTEATGEEGGEESIRQTQSHIDDPSIGAPYIILISGSALRAVDLGRAVKKIKMNTRVVKLFAKHIKMDEQRQELSHDVRVCIGTPHRLLRLSEQGYLKWSRAKLIVWDVGPDQKNFTMLTMKDTKTELWKLFEKYMQEVLVRKKTAKLVLL